MLSSLLLPDNKEMCLLEEIRLETGVLVLKVMATQSAYYCPECNSASVRVHSQYQRKLADLPCVGIPVRVYWKVRRYFCDNRECGRVTFVEQIPSVAARYARRTYRLHKQQTDIGFIVGGEPGTALAHRLEIPTSADTLLGMVRNTPEQEFQAPTILGVDDWAIRKGKTYGTILIDLETRRPVDLLNERSTEALAKWLQAHPGVKIISRDRSNEYAKGATIGAPDAIQVADRFHLVKNLRETLELFLDQNRHCLRAAGEVRAQTQVLIEQNQAELAEKELIPLHRKGQSPTKAAKKSQIIRQNRLEKYKKVMELHLQGMKVRAIARQLGLHRSTVQRYVRAGEFPEMAQRRKTPVKIDPYLDYLEERWQAGCRNRLQLWREICAQGFDGTHQLVYAWSKQKGYSKNDMAKLSDVITTISVRPVITRPWAAKRASWLFVVDPSKLTQENKSALGRMVQVEPLISTALQLAQEFLTMIRNRHPEFLLDWLKRARDSGIEAMKSFVSGLENDLDAVRAALSLPWSNGPTEGNVNRLKLIKRQMYGHANFDLLRKRVLGMPAAP